MSLLHCHLGVTWCRVVSRGVGRPSHTCVSRPQRAPSARTNSRPRVIDLRQHRLPVRAATRQQKQIYGQPGHCNVAWWRNKGGLRKSIRSHEGRVSPLLDESRARRSSKTPQHHGAALFARLFARPLSRCFITWSTSQTQAGRIRDPIKRPSVGLVMRVSGEHRPGDPRELIRQCAGHHVRVSPAWRAP